MILLIDLDGTLTDTADKKFKPYKDGIEETDLERIPLISGAREFMQKLKLDNHQPYIVSDSHPRYVKRIAEEIFDVDFISLADKPNPKKTREFFKELFNELDPDFPDINSDRDDFMVIGDTWLDIELGRILNIATILTTFYRAGNIESRDGVGQNWKHIKSGPTYYATKFSEIHDILANPLNNLLAVEAIFHGGNSFKAVKFRTNQYGGRLIAVRALGRQNSGECDKYGVADKYYEFQRSDRSMLSLEKIAQAVENYVNQVIAGMPQLNWHFLSYVSDKATTNPPNKMKELFDLVRVPIEKKSLIVWKDDMEGSIRTQSDYAHRRDFVNANLSISTDMDLEDKNVIIIDDQFTTGGTAYSICGKLWERGAKSIVFLTLFYLITNVESEAVCPKCGKKMTIKINRSQGNRFYSCTPPRFKGNGCGYIQNIRN